MLVDRKVLIEKDIAALTSECADLYFRMVLKGEPSLRGYYEIKMQHLSSLKGDLDIINHLLEHGRPDGNPNSR